MIASDTNPKSNIQPSIVTQAFETYPAGIGTLTPGIGGIIDRLIEENAVLNAVG